MKLFTELKRRNVFRVALFYIAAAWLVVQVAETVLPVFEVPDIFVRGIIIVLALGFIPSLVFAWAFEMTPEGLRRERDFEVAPEVKQRTTNKLNWATLIVAVMAIAMLTFDRLMPEAGSPGVSNAPVEWRAGPVRGEPATVAGESSIAVLPFVNLSGDSEQTYFAEGVSEEILNRLAAYEGLKVIARTSSFAFKDSSNDIARISEHLGVNYLLQGSVRRDGEQLRIAAQLIDHSGAQIWTRTFNRDQGSIFTMQDEIAEAVAENILPQIAPLATRHRPVQDFEAYSLYLKGRDLLNVRTAIGLRAAVRYYEQAISRDGRFAAAYAGLADSYIMLHTWGFMAPREAMPRARQALADALALDDTLAEAHASLGFLLKWYEWDWEEAEKEFQRALRVNPNYATAHHWYSLLLSDLGRHAEALASIRQARRLDPLSPIIGLIEGRNLYVARRYVDAVDAYYAALKIEPDHAATPTWLAFAYDALEQRDAAMAQYRRAVELNPGNPVLQASLAYNYAIRHEFDRA